MTVLKFAIRPRMSLIYFPNNRAQACLSGPRWYDVGHTTSPYYHTASRAFRSVDPDPSPDDGDGVVDPDW